MFVSLTLACASASVAEGGPSLRALYERAQARERHIRDAGRRATHAQIQAAVARYDDIVRRYPASGYSDNALWQGAGLASLAYNRFGREVDRRTAERMLRQLRAAYPSSSLVPGVDAELGRLRPAPVATTGIAPPRAGRPAAAYLSGTVAIRGITRTVLADAVRVSIELDQEVPYREERLETPQRLFFDLKGVRPAVPGTAPDGALRFPDDIVREIRLGPRLNNTTRVVFDVAQVSRYSVFALYNPYRLVIDFERAAGSRAAGGTLSEPSTAEKVPNEPPLVIAALPPVPSALPAASKRPLASTPATPVTLPVPSVPAANSNGKFSLARQLGLGISRIVLDPGHGGHDPGASGARLAEAELVLDVALKLEGLLLKQPGVEVVLTRRTDVYVPLEERTAIANREGADLFLSIHANASRNGSARGVETYFLNFASNPEAEALAARENLASAGGMHSLPEIVRAIALNNKLDESRDFATLVQRAMVRRLRADDHEVRDLGVKQAPFVVLIGAGMPSVLSEIAFVTNKEEAQLLRTVAYRQKIAEALLHGVLQYQRTLKKIATVAQQ
ncbi:MAG: N-acetylmuramoyl-L-alanine amidase [Acidobacteria bacterium]|nr:N-acetylmuramoyl-L-alanine amidase [Acidobacteriota bacterium]